MPSPVKIRARVSEVLVHADDLQTYVLAPERPVPRFLPGQFLHLALDHYDPSQHWPDSRAFSIASSPSRRDRVRITISRKGGFTRRIFAELTVDREVWIKLPYGEFTPPRDQRSLVLLAGGTGVTPFVSFIAEAAEKGEARPIALHYAARNPDLLIYRRELESCAAALAELKFSLYAEDNTPASGPIRRGRISVEEVWAQQQHPDAALFYLSGPMPMIEAHRQKLQLLGAAPEAIMVDRWG